MTPGAQSRDHRSLVAVERADAVAVLVQSTGDPVLRDDWPNGFDYVCGHCGQLVLASCVVDDQLWDLGFHCFGCKGLSMSPPLPAGMALPPRVVMAPPGRYVISGTVSLDRVVVVGQAAVERRQTEVGPKGATFGNKSQRPSPTIGGADQLQQLVERVRNLLGSTFDTLDLSDHLGRASATPPKKRNPLMVVVHDIRTAIATFATATPIVDVRPVMELVTLLDTLERWKNHPLWPKIVQSLGNEYLHTVITLACGSFLEDAGNGVVFQEAASGRAADLLLIVGAQQRALVEIKVPQVLRAPSGPLGYHKWLEIIKTAVKGARTGEKGQLSRQHPGMLVLGGFHLEESDANDFQRAATDYLTRATKAGRHAHLMGIVLLSFGTAVARSTATSEVHATLRPTVAANPGYKGNISLSTKPRPPT